MCSPLSAIHRYSRTMGTAASRPCPTPACRSGTGLAAELGDHDNMAFDLFIFNVVAMPYRNENGGSHTCPGRCRRGTEESRAATWVDYDRTGNSICSSPTGIKSNPN